jgi:hypothetical protein
MQLDIGDLIRPDPRALVGRPQQALLRAWIGHGEPIPPTVVVDGASSDDGQNPVAGRDGGVQRPEHHQSASLSAHESVRPRIEGETAAVRR